MGYIGAGISRFNTADELTVTGDAEFNGNANFGDSDKAQFGAGNDLQIYHDGSNSYIDDAGAGDLFIRASNNHYLRFMNGDYAITTSEDGDVGLRYDNSQKLVTTSSGVDVTGTVTATTFQANAGGTFTTASGNDLNIVYPDSRSLFIKEGSTTHVTVNNVGNVGIGTASVDNKLHLENAGSLYLQIENTSTANKFYVGNSSGSAILESTGSYSMNFKTNSTERMRLDSSGNLLVGGTSLGENGAVTMGGDGRIYAIRASDTACFFGRTGADGSIVNFTKDGTTVGQITALSSRMGIGTNDVGFFFDSTNDAISPFNPSTNATVDNTVDLGTSSKRFKHGYFANTVYTASVAGITDNDTYINFANNNIMQFITGGSEMARFAPNQGLLVGTTGGGDPATAGAQLDDSGYGMFVRTTGTALFVGRGDTGTLANWYRAGSVKGSLSIDSSGVTYNTTSDIRLKQDIEPLEATDKLMAMNPVSYAWKADPDGQRSMGFIAQEMQEVMPEAVSTGDDDMMQMDYGRITPILVSALQDAHKKIEQLAAEIAELKAN
jgi:hypothetical protein